MNKTDQPFQKAQEEEKCLMTKFLEVDYAKMKTFWGAELNQEDFDNHT